MPRETIGRGSGEGETLWGGSELAELFKKISVAWTLRRRARLKERQKEREGEREREEREGEREGERQIDIPVPYPVPTLLRFYSKREVMRRLRSDEGDRRNCNRVQLLTDC